MFNNKELSQSLPEYTVNIETKLRSNLFTWRGQFSPQLIESLLKAYAHPESRVFDPFLGSGTVLYESGRLGLSAAGCEINPAAIAFAKIYELLNESIYAREIGVRRIDEFISVYLEDLPLIPSKSMVTFPEDVLVFHKTIKNHVVKKILTALIVGLDFGVKKVDLKRLLNVWRVLRSNIEDLPYCEKKLECFEADARQVPVQDDTFDIVVTSPPYINVFNYHQNYRQSVESLGIDVLSIAKSEIGSNRKFRGNRFLTVIQYCMDMSQVFEELKRVCTREAKIIFIVGRESNVKKVAFFNADILKSIAYSCGFSLKGQQDRLFMNKFGQGIFEEILRFEIKTKTPTPNAIEKAREIGINAFKVTLNEVSQEVKPELLNAIEKAKEIRTSPYLGE